MTARLRVLIVEDSETDAKLIVRELGRTGHAIETERVQDAATLRAALERPWDVVISDWSMPVLTADEAMAIVRERQPDVPFIIVSGTIGEEAAVATVRAGASDFLLKDRLVRLGAAVERELRDSQLRAAHRRAIDDLRASEARYRMLFENSPLPKWLYDVETLRILEVNEAAVRHYGYPRDELLAMTIAEIRHAGDVAGASDDARGSSMGAVQQWTASHRKKDGTVIDVEESGYTFTLGDQRARLVVVQDITERLRAEEALRASEEQFRLLLDSTGEAIYGIDLDGNCTFANAACARMIGFLDGAQLIGRNMHQLIHHTRPDGMPYPVAECRLYQAGLCGEGGVFDDEVLFRVDGSRFAAEYRAFPLRRGGVRVGAVISFVDVTARREAEQSMRWLAAIVDAAAEGIIGTDARGIITSWNPGATRIYGYGAAEALGRHISLMAPPDRSGDARERFARAVEGAIVQDYETERVRKDGRRIEVAVTLSPIRDAAGAVRGVSGVTRDITERKIAEHQVRLLHTIALAASQAEDLGAALEVVLRLLCEATGVPVAGAWVPGASGALEHRAHWARSGDGETVRRLVDGWSFGPERGLPGRVLATRKPAWIADLAADADFLRAEVALELGLHAGFALPIVVGDEVVAVLELFFAEPRPPDSRLIELVDALAAHVGSVLQRRRAEEALRRSEEQLRQAQKMEAIGSLAGGIAHDFNNLLSVILTYAEMLIGDFEPCDPMRKDLEEVKKVGERAAALTRQLLAFSRCQILQPRIVDLEDVVSGMAAMLRRLIGEDVQLTVIPATLPARVCVDPGQIEQVIMNLAVNARDAMPQGGKLTVELGHVELDAAYAADHPGMTPGRHVMLAVTDTGVGMDRATQARIFEPFFTTKEPGKGTGLGLSTVFGIVRQSAGTVWVYSEPGIGTTFKVYLPVAGAESKPVSISRSAAPVRLRGSETILLVEDDDHVRRLVRTVLVRHGYNVLEASNGGEALLICEQDRSPIHALLTDVVMPRMSGRRLAARLRSLRPELRVLYMSGYPDGSVVEHGLVDDLASYIQKPITTETLLTVLRTALGDGA